MKRFLFIMLFLAMALVPTKGARAQFFRSRVSVNVGGGHFFGFNRGLGFNRFGHGFGFNSFGYGNSFAFGGYGFNSFAPCYAPSFAYVPAFAYAAPVAFAAAPAPCYAPAVALEAVPAYTPAVVPSYAPSLTYSAAYPSVVVRQRVYTPFVGVVRSRTVIVNRGFFGRNVLAAKAVVRRSVVKTRMVVRARG